MLFNRYSIEEFQEQLEEFEESLDDVQDEIPKSVDVAVRNTSNEFKNDVLERLNRNTYIENEHTDRNTPSLFHWEISQKGSGKYDIFTLAPHARAFEYGSGSYFIDDVSYIPENPNDYIGDEEPYELSDIRRISDKGVYFSRVEHTGVEGQHFLRETMNEHRRSYKLALNIADHVETTFDKEI